MAEKPGGYGRYKDDPNHVGCPRAKTDMTPCVARDGSIAVADDDGVCVGCGAGAVRLLNELTELVTGSLPEPRIQSPTAAADRLTEFVREVTEPRP